MLSSLFVLRAVLITRIWHAQIFRFGRFQARNPMIRAIQSCHRHKVPPLRWTRIDWTRRPVDPERKSFRLFF